MKLQHICYCALLSIAPALLCPGLAAQTPAAAASQNTPAEASPAELTRASAPVVALPISVGDEMDVSVFNVPEMASHQRVNGAGDIYLPLVGKVHITGLTSEEAEALVERRLRDGGFVRDPHVSLYVKEYHTSGIAILGEVMHPGIYPSAGAEHLWDLMLAAGGTTERAGSRVVIRHHDSGESTAVEISKDPEQAIKSNVEVLPGDSIVVSRAGLVYVLGEVVQSAGYLMDDGDKITVLQALAKAHGPTKDASLNGARLLRKSPDGTHEIPIRLQEMLRAKAEDMAMQSDDILFIPGSRGKYAARSTLSTILTIATGVAIRGY